MYALLSPKLIYFIYIMHQNSIMYTKMGRNWSYQPKASLSKTAASVISRTLFADCGLIAYNYHTSNLLYLFLFKLTYSYAKIPTVISAVSSLFNFEGGLREANN